MVQLLGKQYSCSSKTLNLDVLYDLTALPLGIHPKEKDSGVSVRYLYLRCTGALFLTAERGKQSRCPSPVQ